jgi:hypothetical protein
LIVFSAGKSLSSGYGSLSESASVFWAKGLSAAIPRFWTFSSWNLLKSAFLADRFATQVGTKAPP